MYLYENAIEEDINKLFISSKVRAIVADSLSEGLRRVAAEKEDKITLPIIMIVGGSWRLDDYNFYSLMHGSFSLKDTNNEYVKSTNIIPFTPRYQMYILAQTSRECDMLTREIIFHYFMNPTLTVKIPYGIDDIHTFSIIFSNDVDKNQNAQGLVSRVLNFTLQGAYLWHNNTFDKISDVTVTSIKSKYDE